MEELIQIKHKFPVINACRIVNVLSIFLKIIFYSLTGVFIVEKKFFY